MNIIPYDMPKLECPFVKDENHLITPMIAENYEWVFNDPNTIAVEKLDGTNVSVIIENGQIASIFNRKTRIPFFNKGKRFIIEGIFNSFESGYLELTDGQWFGELIGQKVQGNPYNLKENLWLPFETYCKNRLVDYNFRRIDKDFEAISNWMKEMPSYYYAHYHKVNLKLPFTAPYAEGVVFYHPDGRRAKLRRDQFSWYEGKRHKQEEIKNEN